MHYVSRFLSKSNKFFKQFYLGSSYFAIDGILPLEVILLYPFLCVYAVTIARFLALMLWHMDSAAVLQCNGYR